MIVNHLPRLLGERRMSVSELHRVSGVPYLSLHQLYHGRAKRADFGTLAAVCRALGIGIGDLLEYVPAA